MPCRDGGPDCEQPTAPSWMLCEAMIIIEKAGVKDECSQQLLAWWRAHSLGELDRVRREAAEKLDPRERQALGIDERGKPLRKAR